ncbi:MAG TPA: cytochrome c oxidase subunit II [Gemmatimonadota bacterium]|nr:cytochrome c oxidase subunit II [Gemmatimonadota bacterium]
MNDATYVPGAARRRRVGAVALALSALVLVSACGGPFPQSAMDPASDMATRLQDLFAGILWWAIGVFVIVEGALLVGIFKYRDRRVGPADGERAEPRHMHGNTLLELAWTLAPALVLVFIAVPTMTTIWDVDRLTTDPDALTIEVIGHQWWWEFRYPDYDLITANEAYIPEGRTVEFLLTSADVIHSFWVPRLAGKRDVMPGHETHLWFTADSVGRFTGQCAEFCGLSHALMKLEVVVATPEDFAAWVEAQTQPSPVLQAAAEADTIEAPQTRTELAREVVADQEEPGGAAEAEAEEAAGPAAQDTDLATIIEEGQQLLMTKGCIACHRIQGTPAAGVLGPDLSHVGSRRTIAAGILENTTENMIRWLRDPGEVKPGALMPALQLSEEELRTLAAYLRSLE